MVSPIVLHRLTNLSPKLLHIVARSRFAKSALRPTEHEMPVRPLVHWGVTDV